MPTTGLDSRVARFRVAAGGALALVVILYAKPRWDLFAAGVAVSALGELVRFWASGFIRKNSALAIGGPYRHTRNPLYVGNLLLGSGVIIAAANPWLAAAYVLYYAVFYGATISHESRTLRRLFGAEFDRYCDRVPAFFPRLKPAPIEQGAESRPRFDPTLVRKNREARAALAVAVVYALLALRRLIPWP